MAVDNSFHPELKKVVTLQRFEKELQISPPLVGGD
jgi:hypothetical protein